jgi:hypothetical protein
MKNLIFIHVFLINDWYQILEEQLEKISKSGLLDNSEIMVCAQQQGIDLSINILNQLIKKYRNTKLFSVSSVSACGECTTIKLLREFCENLSEKTNILYIHSKGVTQYSSPREVPVREWRRMMEFFLIDRWEDCVDKLSNYGYDCCGINYQDHAANIDGERKLIKIFNGNFFWVTSDYVKKINKNFNFFTRYCPENWVLSQEHNAYVPFNEYANKNLYINTNYNYLI